MVVSGALSMFCLTVLIFVGLNEAMTTIRVGRDELRAAERKMLPIMLPPHMRVQ